MRCISGSFQAWRMKSRLVVTTWQLADDLPRAAIHESASSSVTLWKGTPNTTRGGGAVPAGIEPRAPPGLGRGAGPSGGLILLDQLRIVAVAAEVPHAVHDHLDHERPDLPDDVHRPLDLARHHLARFDDEDHALR